MLAMPHVSMREVMGVDGTVNLGNRLSRKNLVSFISCNFCCGGHPLIQSVSAHCGPRTTMA